MSFEKKFLRKPTNGNFKYKWGNIDETFKKDLTTKRRGKKFCTAEPFSQGEDFKTGYVYRKVVKGGVEQRFAYVECDYVK